LSNKQFKGLVIVESPAKAKKINSYLGDSYRVLASMGHVCDLPKPRRPFPQKSKRNNPGPSWE